MIEPHSGERGTVAVEVAVLAPALVALLLLVVYAGRVTHANGEVQRAATQAARAASLRQTAAAATSAAQATAANGLRDSGFVCSDLATSVDTSRFAAGGSVAVTVRCTADMRDVTLLGVPGRRTFTATSSQVIDRYRGGGS